MAHTPGPWLVSNDTIGSDHGDIARVHFQSSRTAKGWDDRSLIAAAPELLAALKELASYDEGSNDPGDYGYDVLQRCKAAIAKAEGRHHADA